MSQIGYLDDCQLVLTVGWESAGAVKSPKVASPGVLSFSEHGSGFWEKESLRSIIPRDLGRSCKSLNSVVFFLLIFYWSIVLHNVVLVSMAQQNVSAIHISSSFWTSHFGHHSALKRIPWTIQYVLKTTMRYLLISVRMTIIKQSINNKCWKGCREKGILLHSW